MLKIVSLILVVFLSLNCNKSVNQANTANSSTITKLPLKRLTESPSLQGDLPRSVRISPDGKILSFLKSKKEDYSVLDLWTYDLETGKPKLLVDSNSLVGNKKKAMSDEEAAMRERKRIRSTGIVQYSWSKQGDKILFPIGGDLYLYKLGSQKPVSRVTKTDDYETEPMFSPMGNYISFIRNYNVYIVDLKTMTEKQVTFSGAKGIPMGSAEFIAQEEMSRYRGYFWSPNEDFIAINKVDNTPIKETDRFEIYTDEVKVVKQRYPYAGTPNAKVSIHLFKTALSGKKQKPLDVQIAKKDFYIPQINWLPNKEKSILFYSVQSRDQKSLDIMTFDTATKKPKKIFTEKDAAWVDIRHDYIFLKNSPKLLWVSERSGHTHLYSYDLQTGKSKALTSGDWSIRSLLSVDEKKNTFYFTGTKDSPLENHLYQASLSEKGAIIKITEDSGFHSISMENSPQFYLDYFSNPTKPTSLALHDLKGKRKFFIKENKVNSNHPLHKYKDSFSNWEYGETTAANGKDKLYYKVLKPKNFDPSKKYPLIQYVYGGPGVQLVTKAWSRSGLYHQILAQNGFLVLVADNRGTPNRGRDFERSYYLKFGDIEVQDQSKVLSDYVSKNKFVDSKNIGIYGHSYGGYLSLMLMMQKPELYSVGVSGAPVVDWALYDTHYTERFIGTPKQNPKIYKSSNVLTHAENLKGKLLVVHGMADDNVLYKNSLILYSTLQEKEILFDVMPYPGAKHSIARKKSWRQHYLKTSLNYFKTHLTTTK